jgi:hypothetical protein
MRSIMLSIPLLAMCPPPPGEDPPALETTTTTTTTETSESTTSDDHGDTGTDECFPHFVPFGIGEWACFCDTLIVDPALCGCVIDDVSCACPSYPCEEHPCSADCTHDGTFCHCGTLVTTDNYCL